MNENLQIKLFGDFQSFVTTAVVDENDTVDTILWDRIVGNPKSLRRIIGRHYDHDLRFSIALCLRRRYSHSNHLKEQHSVITAPNKLSFQK